MALQIAPLIVAERRILISLYLFMAGVILFHLLPSIWHSGEYLNWLLGGSLLVSITGLGAAIYARHSARHDRGLFILVAFTVGFALASPQFAQHDQPRIKHGVTADIQGTLIKIDGNADARNRSWIRLDATSDIAQSGILPAGGIVCVTTDKWQDQQYLGGAIAMRARLYPPPDRVLYGTPYYGRRARVDDVLAANNGTERSYKPLSDFLSSMAELRMGKSIEPADQTRCLPSCKHDFSNGISAGIVLRAKGLTVACKDLETAFVLTSVTPR